MGTIDINRSSSNFLGKNDASNMDGFETLASVPVAKKTRRLSGSSNTSYPSKQGSIKENESADSSDIESSDCSPSSEVENDGIYYEFSGIIFLVSMYVFIYFIFR